MSKKSKQQRKQQTNHRQLTLGNTPFIPDSEMSNNTNAVRIVKVQKGVPGFFSCNLEHEVTKTKCTISTEVKIPPELWQEVLAFFRWTYQEFKSESQVRLFVNGTTKEWKAWAFPQKANTGMTAVELPDDPKTAAQRRQFGTGWLNFGTVHHHCSSSAFQSGTDEANEQNQDGLHITVGHMDKEQYDLHARLYIGGIKFTPDMSVFWEVGDFMSDFPGYARRWAPKAADVALAQMSEAPPKDFPFPNEWRENIITPPPPPRIESSQWPGSRHTVHSAPFRRPFILRGAYPQDHEYASAMVHIAEELKRLKPEESVTMAEIVELLRQFEIGMDDFAMEMFDICCKNDLLPGNLANKIEEELKKPAKPEKKETKQIGFRGGPAFEYDAAGKCVACGGGIGAHTINCPYVQAFVD